jgi:hypothetical protein
MKYELEPDNRSCADETLLDDIRRVASHLGKTSLTRDEYDAYGRFCGATMQNRFGSWNIALEKSGLRLQKRNNIPRDELIEDLKRVASLLGVTGVSKEEYEPLGKFSSECLARRFGSWGQALQIAGLDRSPNWHPKLNNDDLFRNMAAVWEAVGRQPKQSDFRQSISRVSVNVYTRRFGSWRKALEAFVAAANDGSLDTPPPVEESKCPSLPKDAPIKRTAREPSWRLRFLVNRRDRFTCRACGRSPATHIGTVLHVDHTMPWSQGGETIFENLQTLCEVCNLGKSDLSMNVEEDNTPPLGTEARLDSRQA